MNILFTIIILGFIGISLGNNIGYPEYASNEIEERLAGGHNVTEQHLALFFKYQVGLYCSKGKNTRELCGGVLVHPKIILTAAHCVKDAPYVAVFMGTLVRPKSISSVGNIIVYAKDIIVHDDFSYSGTADDIAIIKLSEPVKLSKYIGTIELPPKDFDCENGEGWVSGWGDTDNTGKDPEILQFTKVKPTECMTDHKSEKKLCSSGEDYSNVCNGDSGGPYTFYDGKRGPYVCGLNSYMHSDLCINNLPRVHTSIPYYLNSKWICDNSERLVGCDYN